MAENLALFLIAVIGAAVTYFIRPFIKMKLDAGEFERLQYWINIAVRFYEDYIKTEGEGLAKKSGVVKFLQSKGFDVSEDELNMMIDAVVNELNGTEWKV